jgi:hypothetical protein
MQLHEYITQFISSDHACGSVLAYWNLRNLAQPSVTVAPWE